MQRSALACWLPAQREAIERWAVANRVTVAAWHEEHVAGAAPLSKRVELLRAIGSVKREGASLLVVATQDRLARDEDVSWRARYELRQIGARVVSADGLGLRETPQSRALDRMKETFAILEKDMIRARTSAALAARGITYGSRPEERAVAARVLSMRESGTTLQGIADALNAEGVACRGRRWHLTTVARICKRGAGG